MPTTPVPRKERLHSACRLLQSPALTQRPLVPPPPLLMASTSATQQSDLTLRCLAVSPQLCPTLSRGWSITSDHSRPVRGNHRVPDCFYSSGPYRHRLYTQSRRTRGVSTFAGSAM